MFAMNGKFIAHAGKRKQLADILLQAAVLVGQLPECIKYIVTEDRSDESSVWVFEIWSDKESHDASLRNEKVKSLISKAMPLLNGAPSGTELNVIGGHGL